MMQGQKLGDHTGIVLILDTCACVEGLQLTIYALTPQQDWGWDCSKPAMAASAVYTHTLLLYINMHNKDGE